MEEYNVYIDESGDEGIKSGSPYFIITAVIVKKENDLKLSNKIVEIKEQLELKRNTQLHWNSIKGFPNKKMIIDTIVNEDFHIVHVVIETKKIKYLKPNKIYFKFISYLFERLNYFTKNGIIDKIYISSRSGLTYERLNQINNDYNYINYEKIKEIIIMPNSRRNLLQLADVCASSFNHSLKYNKSENNLYYTKALSDKFLKVNGYCLGYGIKTVPKEFNLSVLSFLDQ